MKDKIFDLKEGISMTNFPLKKKKIR